MANVTIAAPAGQLRGYLAEPVGEGPWPGVVVVHDALGPGDAIRDHADYLAAAGYLAVIPNLYTRGGMPRCVRATMQSLTEGEGRAFDDIEAARAWLAGQPGCTGRIGVIGFCMGGGFALACAPRGGFVVSAANYGPLPKEAERVLAGACPIVASYGGRDRTLVGQAARLEATLTTLGIPHDVKEYPGAGHSFMERFSVGPAVHLMRVAGMGYHRPASVDAWYRILGFFNEHLRG